MMDPNVLTAVNAENIVTSVAQLERLVDQGIGFYLHVHLSPKLIRRHTRRKQRVKHTTEYRRTTTETGTASRGIPPLIGARKRDQLSEYCGWPYPYSFSRSTWIIVEVAFSRS
jgi:hypothetical protein